MTSSSEPLKHTLLVGLEDFLVGRWFLVQSLQKKTLPVGLEDFLFGWKSSCWDGRLIVGVLTSSSEPLKKHSLLDWKISSLVGSLLVGMEESSLGL